jgi:hypothetical protein
VGGGGGTGKQKVQSMPRIVGQVDENGSSASGVGKCQPIYRLLRLNVLNAGHCLGSLTV